MIDYAVRIINLSEALPDTRAGKHVATQTLKSGTSPAPNYGEAQSAESNDDFVHKIKIALKELRETRVWLLIATRRGMFKPPEGAKVALAECEELVRILAKSVKPAESGLKKGD